jgi:serine-type D-Ala-D-Ala carboxypeptidase/endopeptidase
MRLTHLVVSFGFVGCVVCSGVAASEPEPVVTDAALQQILQERIKAKKAVGLVVGRLQGTNRSIVAVGTMALTNSRPVGGDTVFEIGSITKVFTGTLLADMANRGEVRPDDPATKYLPPTVKMPSRNGKVITLAHLASHRSGLPRELENRPPGENKPSPAYSPELVFEFLSGYELPRDPGSAYEYSNLGMGLLGDSLARLAGTNYEQLVLDRICKPLGMNDTRLKLSEEMQNRFPTGHDYDLKPAKGFERLSLAGAGGLRTTANDFLKFLAAVLNPGDDRVSKAINASQAARTNTGVDGVEVAWGWHFRTVSDELITHSGLVSGFHSFMGVNRKRNRAVVIFSNCSHSSDNIGMRLLDPRGQPDETTLERYVGTYEVTPTFVLTVSREKYDMYVRSNDEPKLEIFPVGRDQLYGPGLSLSFRTNSSGTVTELILRTAGKEQRALRK